jgi:hypothetical protein
MRQGDKIPFTAALMPPPAKSSPVKPGFQEERPRDLEAHGDMFPVSRY